MHMNGVLERTSALDALLFDVCDNLQLTETQHGKAESRYQAIANVISAANSPFSLWDSNLYSQGSMRLRTTVKPISTPHDLDVVCEFDVSHLLINPLDLLQEMYELFKSHGVYGGMVTKKNRCIRIEYKDEFWLDLLPACRDDQNGGTCILVPDREAGRWKPSNPIAYAEWFKKSSRRIIVKFNESRREITAADSALEPLPALQATEEKTMLQLIVQLLKRWRDIHYADSNYPPISIVLTTLAADLYSGEQSISAALMEVLDGIVGRLDWSHARGHRLAVPNPVHREEDFSERWDSNQRAYFAFDEGVRSFARVWRQVCDSQNNPAPLAKSLFGGVMDDAVLREARAMQQQRTKSLLGITSAGRIVPAASAITPMIRNTNHGSR
jgi:hypothetical protein